MLRASAKFSIALLILASGVLGTGAAMAEDVIVDLSDCAVFGGAGMKFVPNVATGPHGSTTWYIAQTSQRGGSTLGKLLGWAGYDAGPGFIYIAQQGRAVFDCVSSNPSRDSNKAGSYFIIDFAGAVVGGFNRAQFDVENVTDFCVLIRQQTTNNWYASDSIHNDAVRLIHAVAKSDNWRLITNSAASGLDVDTASAPAFATPLTFDSGTTDISSGINIDRGGIYITAGNLNSGVFWGLAWQEPIPGGVLVPDVVGQNKAAAAAAIVTAGLVANELAPKVNSDVYVDDQVISTAPAAGNEVAPGSTVNMTISGGPDEYWDWTGGAGPASASLQTNWTLAGTDLTVPANPYAAPIDAGERVAVRSSTTWNAGSLSYGGMQVTSNAVLNVSGATLSNTGGTVIGPATPAVGTPTTGKMVLNAGSNVTCSSAINIGAASASTAGNGTFEVKGGTLTLNTTGGAVNIGAGSAGAGDATGLFHLNGSAATVTIQRNMVLAGPLSTIKWTADAGGFQLITMTETDHDFNLNHGSVVIDATSAPIVVGTPQSFQLVDCGRNINDNGNILTTGVTITPASGTVASEWSVEARDTNANAIPDELWLNYTLNNPPAFTADPFSKPNAVVSVAYSQSIAGDATDPDVGDTLTFSKESGPAWLSVATNGALTGAPGVGDGLNTFSVKVTDSGGLFDAATMNITVNTVSAAKTWVEY